MTFPEPCFIPAGRQPSCRSCLSVTLWLAMATALMAVFTPLGHCATLIPDVCNGTNPVEYHRIDTAGTQIDAESSLGNKLVDPDWELVRIYTTLQVNNRTYAPGYDLPDGFEPAYTLEKNGSALSLAFVHSRNFQYTENFLAIPVPTRYYSLGVLHTKDAWKANDGQTLKFIIRSDWQSQRCWSASSTDQRLSFLTHVVNTTLTKCWKRVTQDQEGWLSGNIYVRTASNERAGDVFPYMLVHGYVYKYMKCENHYAPDELSFHTVLGAFPLNFTVCSGWVELKERSLDKALYIVIGIAGLPTFVVIIFIFKTFFSSLFRLFGISWSSSAPDQNSVNGFPEELSITFLCMQSYSSWKDSTTVLMFFPWCLHKAISIGLLQYGIFLILYLLATVLPIKHVDNQGFDTKIPRISCDNNHIRECIFNYFSSWPLPFVFVSCGIILGHNIVKIINPKWYKFLRVHLQPVFHFINEKIKCRARIWMVHVFVKYRILIRSVVYVVTFIVTAPGLLNIMLMLTYTTIGLAVYHTYILLAVLAICKAILFDILHIADFDETLSPDIARCQRAVDEAQRSLQDTLVMDSVATMRAPSSADNDLDQSIGHRKWIIETSAKLRKEAFWKLCAQDSIVTIVEADPSIKQIKGELEKKIASRFADFLLKSVVLSWVAIVTLLGVQMIFSVLYNSDPNISAWTGFILPGLVFFKPLIPSKLTTNRETTDVKREKLCADAKRIILELLQKEKAGLAESNLGSGADRPTPDTTCSNNPCSSINNADRTSQATDGHTSVPSPETDSADGELVPLLSGTAGEQMPPHLIRQYSSTCTGNTELRDTSL